MSSEDWDGFSQAMRARSQEKRAGNRSNSQRILAERGINFASHNTGDHLIVSMHGKTWDFWPGTGKWTLRGSNRYLRGVFPLIKAIEGAAPKESTK